MKIIMTESGEKKGKENNKLLARKVNETGYGRKTTTDLSSFVIEHDLW